MCTATKHEKLYMFKAILCANKQLVITIYTRLVISRFFLYDFVHDGSTPNPDRSYLSTEASRIKGCLSAVSGNQNTKDSYILREKSQKLRGRIQTDLYGLKYPTATNHKKLCNTPWK